MSINVREDVYTFVICFFCLTAYQPSWVMRFQCKPWRKVVVAILSRQFHWPSVYSVRQWSGRPGFNPKSSHTKDLRKSFLMPPCLTLSNIRYISRVKRSNPGKGVVPSLTHRCGSYWKGSLRFALNYSHQLYFYLLGE